MILVYIENVIGDCKVKGFGGDPGDTNKYFTVESFSFSVERELAESGKAGTTDINIGVGDLQECSISKSMDSASTYLARKAIAGSSVGTVEIKFVETITAGNEVKNVVYLHFKLDNAFVKTWSISGDGDDRPSEDVALWYNKIGFSYFSTPDGKEFTHQGECCWNQVEARPWKQAAMSKTAETHGV